MVALSKSPGRARERLKNAQSISTSIIEQLQKSIYELRPLLLDDLGLLSAINWLIDNNLKTAGIKVIFKKRGRAKRLDRQIEITIFRVVQEALNNIVRHASAEHVEITLHFREKNMAVTIIDDGSGFDIEEASSLKDGLRGFGLLGMKERIEIAGGVFELKSQKNIGTVIYIEIPLNP